MPATDLPPEVLAHILNEAGMQGRTSINQLKNCSLVCSSWRFPAQRELFSSFTVSSLDRPKSPNALPYSVIAKDYKYSFIGPAIRVLQINLRSPLSKSQIDPDFHLFLQHLPAVKTVAYTGDSGEIFFNREVFSLAMRSAIRNLFRLPTLVAVVVKTAGFPLATLSSCSGLRRLVLCSPTRGLPANCDPWYDLREGKDSREKSAITGYSISELGLSGDSEFIGGLTNWLHDAKNGIYAKRVVSAALFFYCNMPTQPRTPLFCNFRRLEYLRISFRALEPGDWLPQLNTAPIIPLDDIRSLVSLRSFQLDFPTTGLLCKDLRQNFILLIIRFMVPLLLLLPNPTRLNVLEIYVMTPTYPPPGSSWQEGLRFAGSAFSSVWRSIDGTVVSRFAKLERFAVYAPWLRYEDVLEIFRYCGEKGIMRRAPYYW